MKYIFLLFFFSSYIFSQNSAIRIATVDSGFGGYFTAKALEKASLELHHTQGLQVEINHFGDTLNAPYGEKSPDEIAQYAAKMIIKAHQSGAQHVYLACNTASSQFSKIREILLMDQQTKEYAKTTYSIIESSVATIKNTVYDLIKKNKQDDIHMAFLVTPATLKSDVYPKHLQEAFGIKNIQKSSVINYEQNRWRTVKGTKVMSAFSSVNFYLPHKQRVFVYQIAPGNWVEMIEYQAHQDIKKDIIRRDLELLTSSLSKDIPFHIVAHFCTHFPVFDKDIKEVLLGQKRIHADAEIIKQGEIFAQEFVSLMKSQKKISEKSPNVSQLSEPKIFITGQNKEETENLVKTIFPDQKTISVETIK